LEPTGSKDPFALRRAANAIVSILVESRTHLPLLLSEVIGAVAPKPEVTERLRVFFNERIDFYLRERQLLAYDVAKAAMAAGSDDLPDLIARANAVTAVRGSADFLAVSAAFKRMKNILAQAAETGELKVVFQGGGGTAEPAEAALWDAAETVEADVKALTAQHDYVAALERIARLRPEVDAFFEQVMVMDPNPLVRRTRLAILLAIVTTIHGISDLSEIVTLPTGISFSQTL